jgi:hypothetical protein
LIEQLSASEPYQSDTKAQRPESAAKNGDNGTTPILATKEAILQTFVDEYKTRDSQSYGLQKRNFWLAVIVALVIFGYTTVAALQWCAMQTSVAEQVATTRPVLMADGINPTDKSNSSADVMIYNFGQTVATEVATAGTLAIAKIGEPPTDTHCKPNGDPSRSIPTTALAPLEKSPKPGIASYYCTTWQFSSSASHSPPSSGEAIYAVGCIYYEGLDERRWYGDICTIWANGSYVTCPEPGRNFTCERGTCRDYRTGLSDEP